MSLYDSFEVIYRNEELVVVNKPHDVPMDGEGHSVTVEKWALADFARVNYLNTFASNGMCDSTEASKRCVQNGGDRVKTPGKKKTVRFVHQLDYATSGVLCVAFSKEMAARLAHCFEMRTTHKAYLAVLRGKMPPLDGIDEMSNNVCSLNSLAECPYASRVHLVSMDGLPNADFIRSCVVAANKQNSQQVESLHDCGGKTLLKVDLPVGHDSTDPEGFRMTVDGRDARESLTYLHVLRRGYMRHPTSGCRVPVTKVILFPRTGRRHQLRVHCHALGFPILGDVTYAGNAIPRAGPDAQKAAVMTSSTDENGKSAEDAWERMMLHAWRLSFPVSVEPVQSGMERYMQKRRRRRETLGISEVTADDGDDKILWTHFETKDPFQCTVAE